MLLNVFGWYDKVDKCLMFDSICANRSTRSVCRGYIDVFKNRKEMNPKEFELRKIATLDDETGEITPIFPNEVVDPSIVYERVEQTEGDVKDE